MTPTSRGPAQIAVAKARSPPSWSAYAWIVVLIAVLSTPPPLAYAHSPRPAECQTFLQIVASGAEHWLKNRRVAALSETVEELRSDRAHGGSWMARRAVEALLEVASEPASTTDTTSPELVDEIVTEEGPSHAGGRELGGSGARRFYATAIAY